MTVAKKHEDGSLAVAIQRAKAGKYGYFSMNTHGDRVRTIGLQELRDLRLLAAEFLRKEATSGD